MIHVRDGLSFSNENSTLAEALARWLCNRKREAEAAAKSRPARGAEHRGQG